VVGWQKRLLYMTEPFRRQKVRWKACNTVNLSCHVAPVTLDLEELDLVDIEGVRFLDMESKNGS